MHVFQFFSALFRAPAVEIVEAALPELAQRRIFVREPQPRVPDPYLARGQTRGIKRGSLLGYLCVG